MAEDWKDVKFSRRKYTASGPALDDARRIELILKVDGKQFVQVQAREPGIVAFVSKPNDQGFDIEVVEASGVRYADRIVPGGEIGPPCDWQKQALDLRDE